MRAAGSRRNWFKAVARRQRHASAAGRMRADDTTAHTLFYSVSNGIQRLLTTRTHHHILFIRVDLLVLELLLLLAGSDIFDLTHTLAASGSVRSISLSRGEVIASANLVAPSTPELQLGCTSAVVADQFVEYFVVTQFSASFHPVYGIVLTVFGECSEGLEAQTSLAPDSGGC
jgi:hypothetical protein